MPLFASLTLVKETALKEAASLKSPLLTSFIENYVRRQKLFLTNEQIGKYIPLTKLSIKTLSS